MSNKKLLGTIALAVMLALIFLIIFTTFRGTPLRNMVAVTTLLAIYFLLIVSYLWRIALVFFGVFAVYKLLQERVNLRDYHG